VTGCRNARGSEWLGVSSFQRVMRRRKGFEPSRRSGSGASLPRTSSWNGDVRSPISEPPPAELGSGRSGALAAADRARISGSEAPDPPGLRDHGQDRIALAQRGVSSRAYVGPRTPLRSAAAPAAPYRPGIRQSAPGNHFKVIVPSYVASASLLVQVPLPVTYFRASVPERMTHVPVITCPSGEHRRPA
jgi:hypothetical protein